MLKSTIVFVLALGFIGGPGTLDLRAQTLSPNAVKIKSKVEERTRKQSRTKVKLVSNTTYVGIVSDPGDTSFTITDKSGIKHTVGYSEVKSIGGTGWGSGAKIGLGVAIGAAAVLGVLAAIIVAND